MTSGREAIGASLDKARSPLAAARAVRAIASGSRIELTVAVALDGEMRMRHVVTALPVRLGPSGVERIVQPELSGQEDVRIRVRD